MQAGKSVATQAFAISRNPKIRLGGSTGQAGPAPLQQAFRLTAEIRSTGAADVVRAEGL
jgi:hypothetical protein